MRDYKEIGSEKKTTLPSLRNQDWKTVKTETEKINKLLTNMSMKNITELNEQINAGAKLVCNKIGVPLKKLKTWMGNETGNTYKKSTT